MIWILLLWVVLIAVLLLGMLWRQLRAPDASMRTLVVVPFAVVAGLTCYWFFGRHPATGEWLREYADNKDAVRSMIAGTPEPGAEQVSPPVLARVLQRELAMAPTAEGWYALSIIYGEMQAPAVAVTAARKAVQMAPDEDTPKLLLARGLITENQGRLVPEAHELIDDVLSRQPQHDGAWMMLAMAAMASSDYELALTALDELLARHSDGDAGNQLRKVREQAASMQKNQAWLSGLSVTVEAAQGITPGGTLFVFLRRPGESGQPLAAVRVLADHFPLTIKVGPENWLQAPPAPGTPLVAGARYAMAPGQGVDQAGVTAENQPLREINDSLGAVLQLK